MASGVAGIAVADAGVGTIVGAVEAHLVVHVPTLDPLDVAGDLTQHCAAPQDLGPVQSMISWNRCRPWKGHKVWASIPHRQSFLSTWTALICREGLEGEMLGRVGSSTLIPSETKDHFSLAPLGMTREFQS